jgi:hypothetical protein
MHVARRERPQDQQVQRALQEIALGLLGHVPPVDARQNEKVPRRPIRALGSRPRNVGNGRKRRKSGTLIR